MIQLIMAMAIVILTSTVKGMLFHLLVTCTEVHRLYVQVPLLYIVFPAKSELIFCTLQQACG